MCTGKEVLYSEINLQVSVLEALLQMETVISMATFSNRSQFSFQLHMYKFTRANGLFHADFAHHYVM